MFVSESPRCLVLSVTERIECPSRVIHLPNTELVSGEGRNEPCAIPQLRCTTQALLPGLTFPALNAIEPPPKDLEIYHGRILEEKMPCFE